MSEKRNSSLLGKVTVLIVICCLVMGSFVVNTAVALDGSGTEGDPWRIESLDDFNDFAADANYWDDYTRLETDVNLAGRVYERAVIGDRYYDDGYIGTAFSGVFDGNDHKILNLTIDDGGAGNDNLGLFGNIENGEVRNLGLEGGSVSGGRRVGGLVGVIEEYGTVSNCYSTGNVNGGGLVGGLVGYSHFGDVSNCYSTGDVSGTADHIGGLVGYATGIVSNCYSTGNVSGDYEVGGLMGGNSNSNISNCYSTGDVNGVGEVGGLMGKNLSFVSNCYSTGDVQGAGVENVGGLVGYHYSPGISYCFWDTDTQTHGVTESIGGGSGVVTNVLGLPTYILHQQSTFTTWDFINVWNIGENQTYPYLRVYLAGDINKDHINNFLDLNILCNQWMQEQ